MSSSKARFLSILAKDITTVGKVPSTNIVLPASGVTAATYGSATQIPVLTIDTEGRVTSASTTSVAGVSSFGYNTGSGRLTINTADGGSFTADVTLAPFTTTTLAEGTNQYFTTARARSSISATGTNLGYNSTTGVLSYTQGNTDTVAEGATNLYYTSARARGALSYTTGSAGYNSTSGQITIPGSSTDITEGTKLFYTDARARAALSGGTGVTYNSTTGVIAIGQPVATTDNVTFGNVTVNGILTSDDITSTNITVSGNATITGNLTVSGTTTTVNSTTVSVADINIEVARNATTAAQANGAGLTVTGPTTPATLTYSSADDRWNLNKDLNISRVYGNLTGAVTGNASTASTLQTARSITITGDGSWTVNFDGSANVSAGLTLANSGVTAGTYGSGTAIPVLTIDAKGRVTTATTTSVTIGDGAMTVTAGSGLTGGGQVGTANQTGASSVTISHADTSSVADQSAVTNTFVSGITFDTYGHVQTVTRSSPSGFLTAESDTLATVTGRGASTSTPVTLAGGLTITSGTVNQLQLNTSTGTQSLWVRAGYDSDGTATPAASALNIQFQSSGSSGGTFSFVSGNTKVLSIGGVINSLVALQQSGNQVWHAGNLTNLNQLINGPGYITGYTETDTLASVTGRGASTSTEIYLNGNSLWFGGSTYLRSNTQFSFLTNSGGAQAAKFNGIQVSDSYSGAVPTNGILFGTDTTFTRVGANSLQSSGDLRATIFYDSNDTGYYGDFNNGGVKAWRNSGYSGGISVADTGGYLTYRITTNNHSDGWGWQFTTNDITSGSGVKSFWVTYSGNNAYAAGSMRAPIFYDSDNTAYFADPNSRSLFSSLSVGSSTTVASAVLSVYAGGAAAVGWGTGINLGDSSNYTSFIQDAGVSRWRNYGTGGWDWYSSGGSKRYWGDDSGNSYASASLRAPIFYDNDDTSYYLNPNSTSVLNAVNYWGIQFWNGDNVYARGTNTYGYRFNNYADTINAFLINNSGDTTSYSSSRAPIFYDSADTGYYTNPNAISSMYGVAIRGDNSSVDTSNQIFFWSAGNTTTSAIGFKSNGGSFSNPTGSGDGYNTYLTMDTPGRGWVFREGTGGSNFGAVYTSGWILNNGIWQANASMRSPIFYDSNNTGYYADPASTSQFNTILTNGVYQSAYTSGSLSSGTWYTIAANGGDRASAEFVIIDGTSGLHQSIHFNAAAHFGTTGTIAVISNSFYSGPPIAYIRIKQGSTYDGAALQVYVNSACANVSVYMMHNYQSGGWVLKNWINDNTNPGNISNWGNLTERTRAYTVYNGYSANSIGYAIGSDSKSRLTQGNSQALRITTDTGYLDIGSMNSTYTHYYTDRSANYWDKYGENASSWRAPIFYDSDDTNYYLNPHSSSRLNETYTTNSYTYGWFRNYGNQGLYNQDHGNHWYATGNDYWNLAGNNTSNVGIILRTGGHQGTVRGYVYVDNSNNVGFLNSSGSWRLRVVSGDYSLADGSSMRAQLYYDSNDTSYYVDPHSTSYQRSLFLGAHDSGDSEFRFGEDSSGWYGDRWYWDSAYTVYRYSRYAGSDSLIHYHDTRDGSRITYGRNIVFDNYGKGIVGVYSSYRYQGVFSMGDSYKLPADGTSTGSLYGLAWSHPNAGGVAANLNTHGLLAMENGTWLASLSGSVRARDDMRAPIFYDNNDTGYYVDPAASTSLRTVGDWRANASTWTGEYSGKIQYHSNNWYFQAADQFIWRNSGGSNVVYGDQSGNHWATGSSRSPIFYDSDNTGYYTNPASSSYVNVITAAGGIQAPYIGVNNTDNTNGYGISLYGGYTGGQPTYGLMFQGTSTFGSHGGITSDWSTYFTMNNDSGRGWIFRNVSAGNVASITANGRMSIDSHFEQGNNYAHPNIEWSASGTSTGEVIFYLPGTTSNYGMVHMVFDIYEYNSPRMCTVIVGGHNWSTSWYNTACNVVGYTDKQVRLGVKDGRFCVIFGTTGSSWSYGQIRLRKIQNGSYYNNIMDMLGNWSVTQTTTESFTNITGDLRGFRTPAAMEVDGILYAYADVRSPIYYDYNDTGYYCNPNDTSRLVNLRATGHIYLNSGDPTIHFVDSNERGAALHNNSNLFYILSSNGTGGESWTTNNGYWPVYWNLNNNDATFGGAIWAAGNVTAYSDAKLKENIEAIDSPLDKVLKLRGVYYTLKRDESKTRKVGVIAQEIQEILPEVVLLHKDKEDEEGTLSVDYGNITAVLIEAIKEQDNKIKRLEALVETLINKLGE
jgi:hypothetical protein